MNFTHRVFSFPNFIVVHISYWTKQKIQKYYMNSQNIVYILTVKDISHPLIYQNYANLDKFCKIN